MQLALLISQFCLQSPEPKFKVTSISSHTFLIHIHRQFTSKFWFFMCFWYHWLSSPPFLSTARDASPINWPRVSKPCVHGSYIAWDSHYLFSSQCRSLVCGLRNVSLWPQVLLASLLYQRKNLCPVSVHYPSIPTIAKTRTRSLIGTKKSTPLICPSNLISHYSTLNKPDQKLLP